MFKNIFKKSNVTRIFLADWHVVLNGDRQCDDFIATYMTTEETFKNVNIGLELIFVDDKLERCYLHEFGEKKERELSDEERGMKLPSYPPNDLWQFFKDPDGPHQLGGEVPGNFKLPESEAITPFQYLGYISNEDPAFNWLPFKVHLACPIFLNIQNVYLDYSNPDAPTVINKEEVKEFTSNWDDDLNKDTLIVFEEAKFSTVKANDFGYEIGNAGLPPVIQETEIPVCPVSGRRMRFLCQLLNGVDVRSSNVEHSREYNTEYFKALNFWGDGYLYVYFEPTARTACYFIQNT